MSYAGSSSGIAKQLRTWGVEVAIRGSRGRVVIGVNGSRSGRLFTILVGMEN